MADKSILVACWGSYSQFAIINGKEWSKGIKEVNVHGLLRSITLGRYDRIAERISCQMNNLVTEFKGCEEKSRTDEFYDTYALHATIMWLPGGQQLRH